MSFSPLSMQDRQGSVGNGSIKAAIRLALIGSVSTMSLFAAAPAFAQASPASDASPSQSDQATARASDDEVPIITVTATRRNTDLQKVPATVQVITGEQLTALQVNGVQRVADLVPGVRITPAGGNNIYLRGVGTTSGGYAEAQTAVYVDGVFLPNAAMGLYSFNNIEHIEVLKGPQGTLYGRNATAGLVAVTTRDPGDAVHIDASLGYGSYDTWSQSLYASAPLTDNLAANVSVYNTHQAKGWGRNLFTGSKVFTNDETAVQAKFQWRPTATTKITTNFIYDENNRTTGAGYQVLPGTIAVDGSTYQGKYLLNLRHDPQAPFSAYIGSLKIEQDLGFATLMSLTAYQTSKQDFYNPGNSGALGQPIAGQSITNTEINGKNRTWSQELQLSSRSSGAPFEWVTGLFYFNDKLNYDPSTRSSTCAGNVCAPGPIPTRTFAEQDTLSYSGYADATYRLVSGTHVTLGVRYTDETKRLSGIVQPAPGFPNSGTTLPATTVTFPGGGASPIPTRLHFGKVTFRGVLAQDFGDNIHAYVSMNRGFKAGSYNTGSFTNPPTQPEVLDAYEGGLKTSLFDNRLRLNLSYFFYDYKNVQVRSTTGAGTPVILNVASEHMHGIDGDFVFVPVRGFTINGGFEFLNSKFQDYPGASCITVGPNKVVGGVTVGTYISTTCNLAGSKTDYAVPFSASLGFTYDVETSAGVFSLNGNYHHDSRHKGSPDGSIFIPVTDLFDASVKWESPDKKFDALLFVKNLTDRYTYAVAIASATALTVIPGAPRTYGVRVGFHF